jgi:SAM-dependent methyltransferase
MADSYPAELYAKLHTGNLGDLAFYRAQCSGAESILELGCGYGRVLESLARTDRRLLGLDKHRGLLALAKKRLRQTDSGRIDLVQGDMRRFAFRFKFDRILIPYSGLYCLLSADEVRTCFQQIAKHLQPTGRLVFDAYAADVFHHELLPAEGDGSEKDEIATIVHRGTVYQVVEQATWTREEQRLDVVYAHEPREGGTSIAAHLTHRYLLRGQIAPLLDAAGLRLVSLSGDYEGTGLDADSDLIVATAQLA